MRPNIYDKIDKLIEILDGNVEGLKTVIDNDFEAPLSEEYPVCWILPSRTPTIENVMRLSTAEDIITIMVFDYVVEKKDIPEKRRNALTVFERVMHGLSQVPYFPASPIEYIETVFGKNRVTGVKMLIKLNQ